MNPLLLWIAWAAVTKGMFPWVTIPTIIKPTTKEN